MNGLSKFWKEINATKYPGIKFYFKYFLSNKYIHCKSKEEKELLSQITYICLGKTPKYMGDDFFYYHYTLERVTSCSKWEINSKYKIITIEDLNKGDVLFLCNVDFEPLKVNRAKSWTNWEVFAEQIPNPQFKPSSAAGINVIKEIVKKSGIKVPSYIYINGQLLVQSVSNGCGTVPLLANVSREGAGEFIEVVLVNTGKGARTAYWYYEKCYPAPGKLFIPAN